MVGGRMLLWRRSRHVFGPIPAAALPSAAALPEPASCTLTTASAAEQHQMAPLPPAPSSATDKALAELDAAGRQPVLHGALLVPSAVQA